MTRSPINLPLQCKMSKGEKRTTELKKKELKGQFFDGMKIRTGTLRRLLPLGGAQTRLIRTSKREINQITIFDEV